jgi:hypothetical protein
VAKRRRKNRQNVQDQFRDLMREARELVEEAGGGERLNRRPAESSWSAAECLDHLNATARLYAPILAEAIEDARARGLSGSGRRSGRTLVGRLLCWSQEPPPRFRMSTWSEIEPQRDSDPQELVDEFETLHEELVVRANESADLDRGKIRIRSVLDSRLRLSLEDWFAFLAAHARRHLWQAREALKDSAPESP